MASISAFLETKAASASSFEPMICFRGRVDTSKNRLFEVILCE